MGTGAELNKDGTERWFSRRSSPLHRDVRGRVTQIKEVTRDTTEEKSVQAALRESEAVFHQLAESVDVAFLLRSVDPPEFIPRQSEVRGDVRPQSDDHPYELGRG